MKAKFRQKEKQKAISLFKESNLVLKLILRLNKK